MKAIECNSTGERRCECPACNLSGAITSAITREQLEQAKFYGPTVYGDGRNGAAMQRFVCPDLPRFGYEWRRKDRRDPGVITYRIDGQDVADLEEAARRLNEPPELTAEEIAALDLIPIEWAPLREVEARLIGDQAGEPIDLVAQVGSARGRAMHILDALNAKGIIELGREPTENKLGPGFEHLAFRPTVRKREGATYRTARSPSPATCIGGRR